ncbi:hypothetical protein D6777_02160 [Candidatus Woesearchaeota archaeon]|nr:MAG: hypothetical protein D6777_02160 [Candidatus Woesearchaeota archaeon]
MLPHTHFLLPFTIAYYLSSKGLMTFKMALLAGLVGVLIDLDHLLEYFLHTHKLSLIGVWNNSLHFHRFKQRTIIHRWKGALLVTLLIILTFLISEVVALAIAIGYYSHLILDYVYLKLGYFSFKLGKIYFKESYFEIILDVLFLLILLKLFIS